jgi:ferric-dicitrate binding protein FerR (iron transport regulator)
MEDLIARYLSDELSLEELEKLQAWRSASQENEKQFLTLQEIWFSSITTFYERRFSKGDDYKQFLAYAGSIPGPIRRRKRLQTVWRSAAVIALLFVTSYATFHFRQPVKNNTFANTYIEASWGSQVKTSLPDGTTVWLNAGSELIYSQGFGINDRNVRLTGEGYFEVAHNADLPFCVQAGDLQINVLGTKFNVRNHLDDHQATVSLLEGSVSITNTITPSEEITIEPNQKISFDRESGDFRLTEITASHSIGWINGNLFYDDELLVDIVRDLERYYNVTITVEPNAAHQRFYIRLNRTEKTIEQIVEAMASTGRITYSMTGREIVLK